MIIQNKISGVIHTENCGNVKQMNPENIRKLDKNSPVDEYDICEHCMDKEAQKRFKKQQYEQKIKKIEEKRKQKIEEAIITINKKCDEEIRKIKEKYQKMEVELV